MGDTTRACFRERTLLIAQEQILNKQTNGLVQGCPFLPPTPTGATESKKLHSQRTRCKQINTCIQKDKKILHELYPSREPCNE